MLWSSPFISTDGLFQEFSLIMASRQKYSSFRPSKKWAMIRNSSRNYEASLWLRRQKNQATRVITLPVSFGTLKNHRIEHIILDVVDMPYPYNTIFGQGLLSTFEAALHSGYLCLKIQATFGVITKFGCQKKPETLSVGLPWSTRAHIS
jgi:hypothetical protein